MRPPMKKPITAIKDGTCKFDKPLIACPDVQPPAYLVPKPTRIPPPSKTKKPFKDATNSNPKIWEGFNPPSNLTPNAFRSLIVAADS